MFQKYLKLKLSVELLKLLNKLKASAHVKRRNECGIYTPKRRLIVYAITKCSKSHELGTHLHEVFLHKSGVFVQTSSISTRSPEAPEKVSKRRRRKKLEMKETDFSSVSREVF